MISWLHKSAACEIIKIEMADLLLAGSDRSLGASTGINPLDVLWSLMRQFGCLTSFNFHDSSKRPEKAQ
jgi:hypothetical protein